METVQLARTEEGRRARREREEERKIKQEAMISCEEELVKKKGVNEVW